MPSHESDSNEGRIYFCRWCNEADRKRVATIIVRHGMADSPACAECAEWWSPSRLRPIRAIETDLFDTPEDIDA